MISRITFDGSSDAYLTLFNVPRRAGAVNTISIAVAYATFGGVQVLQPFFVAHRTAAKRCLVGIDWYRSDPAALDALALLPNSEVRIYDGERVLARRGQPTTTYHPKAYVIEATNMGGLILGSGNLSVSGLTAGIEVGEATWAKRPAGDPTLLWTMFGQTLAWFDRMWRVAPSYAQIANPYREAFIAPDRIHIPNDEDLAPIEDRFAPFSADQLRLLRSATHFWVETRRLSRNRGPNVPGNELDLRVGSRLFFGYPLDNNRSNHPIGPIRVTVGGATYDRPLRYNDISMEVIALPPPGQPGTPQTYDDRTLCFERYSDEYGVAFRLTAGRPELEAQYRQASERKGFFREMNPGANQLRGRRWGVFFG